ncbi:MAG TPA: hypothetical protein DEB40_10740 [Elusimicrobia bacterium]|nr:hypothetical protein [Elusimicrobiota bacterium]HBT62207.1 hypothetical protein [Elusimicrobiota bacterium]
MTKTATEVIEEVLAEKAVAPETEVREETDVKKIPQRTPPKRGLCRRCGENKPINRLMLCYPCWVKSELENHGWREGMPHPDWCHCEGIKDHVRRSNGN